MKVLLIGRQVVQYKKIWMTESRAQLAEKLEAKKFQLMKLPVELREAILELLTPAQTVAVSQYDVESDPVAIFPATAQVGDGQLRLETLRIALKTIRFKLRHSNQARRLQGYLKSLNFDAFGNPRTRTGLDVIHSLHLPQFAPWPNYKWMQRPEFYIELMQSCKNLTSVELGIISERRAFESVHKLRSWCKLDSLVGLPSLKRVELKCSKWHYFGQKSEDVLGGFAAWLKSQNTDRDLEVIVAWRL